MKSKLEKLDRQISEISSAIRMTTGLRKRGLVTRKEALEKERAKLVRSTPIGKSGEPDWR